MANGDPRKPHIDPGLRRYRVLIDSLMTAAGTTPDSIVLRAFLPVRGATGYYDPETRTISVGKESRNPRRTLLHEFGHAHTFEDQRPFFEWLDPEAKGKTASRRDVERFADVFADAFEEFSRGKTASKRKGVDLILQAIMGRFNKEEK